MSENQTSVTPRLVEQFVMSVLPIMPFECEPWLKEKHYARRTCPISYAFGAYRDGELIGIVTYGTPASSTLLRGVCGEEWKDKVLELNRLCCENTKNMASWLVGQSLRMLPKPSVVVSFADTGQGHVGYVYQATNFLYTGLSTKFRDPKVKGLEHQHHATYGHGKSYKQMREEYGDKLYFVDRSRKHRYIFFCGSKTQKQQMMKDLKYQIQGYPKGDSKRYDAGGKVETQGILFAT